MKTKDMVYAALFAALIAVLGLIPPIPLPFIPVPITAQTLGVMLAGGFLGKKLGGLSALLVVVLVALGAPILSGGRGGLSVIAGPTGGFLLSWPVAAFVIGYLTEKVWANPRFWKLFLINMIGGLVVVYLIGAPYLAFISDIPVGTAILSSAVFFPGDIIKALIATFICIQVKTISPINERFPKL